MSRVEELQMDARRLADEGQFQGSYLALREAAAEAKRLGLHDEVMLCLMNARIAGGKAKVSSKELFSLLLEVRTMMHEHSDSIPRELNYSFTDGVKLAIHNHIEDYTPNRQRLEESLNDLVDVHPSDRFLAWSNYHSDRGQWKQATEFAEQAWSNYQASYIQPGFASSLHPPSYVSHGFYSYLALDEKVAAQQWLEAFAREVTAHDCPNCQQHYLIACVEYALEINEPINVIRTKLAEAQAQETSVDAFRGTDYLAVKVHLRDSGNGDPCDSSHPAWIELTRRNSGDNRNVRTRYQRSIAVLDFRLAALRYAAGLAPVHEDQKTMLRFRCSAEDVGRRLVKARNASQLALRAAQVLDEMLECDWRQRKVQSRLKRIEEIASAAQLPDRKNPSTNNNS